MENTNQLDSITESLLRNIEAHPITKISNRVLQQWNRKKRELSYFFQGADAAGTVSALSGVMAAKTKSSLMPRLRTNAIRKLYDPKQVVCGGTLHERLTALLRCYVIFPDERVYDLIAVWIMGTYLYEIFSYYGFLHLYSRQKRAGKTTTIDIISLLAFEASTILTAPSVPTLRETAANGGVIVLDSVERWKRKNYESYNAMMEMLDSAFRKNAIIPVMVRTTDGNFTPKLTPVYAPYALAGIGEKSLSDTARDRAFRIKMQRKPVHVLVEPFRLEEASELFATLIDDLYVWALQNAAPISHRYDNKAFRHLVTSLGLQDRATDIWSPILAIADELSPEVVQRLQSLAYAMGQEIECNELSEADEMNLLQGMKEECQNHEGEWRVITSELTGWAAKIGIQATPQQIRDLLETVGAEQKSSRIAGTASPRRSWILNTAMLEIAIADHLPEDDEV